MGDDFFRTRMGWNFFESTVPRIADELACLNHNLEALVALLEQRGGGARPAIGDEPAAQPSSAPATDSR